MEKRGSFLSIKRPKKQHWRYRVLNMLGCKNLFGLFYMFFCFSSRARSGSPKDEHTERSPACRAQIAPFIAQKLSLRKDVLVHENRLIQMVGVHKWFLPWLLIFVFCSILMDDIDRIKIYEICTVPICCKYVGTQMEQWSKPSLFAVCSALDHPVLWGL